MPAWRLPEETRTASNGNVVRPARCPRRRLLNTRGGWRPKWETASGGRGRGGKSPSRPARPRISRKERGSSRGRRRVTAHAGRVGNTTDVVGRDVIAPAPAGGGRAGEPPTFSPRSRARPRRRHPWEDVGRDIPAPVTSKTTRARSAVRGKSWEDTFSPRSRPWPCSRRARAPSTARRKAPVAGRPGKRPPRPGAGGSLGGPEGARRGGEEGAAGRAGKTPPRPGRDLGPRSCGRKRREETSSPRCRLRRGTGTRRDWPGAARLSRGLKRDGEEEQPAAKPRSRQT